MRTPSSRHSYLSSPELSAADLDPYLVDETTLTLDDWRHRPAWDFDVEVVRLHQHHPARLVA